MSKHRQAKHGKVEKFCLQEKTNKDDIQEQFTPEIGGADVKALYPNLSDLRLP